MTCYFSNGRNYEDDVEKYFVSMKNAETLIMSITMRLNVVKSYMMENDLELPPRFWKKNQPKV